MAVVKFAELRQQCKEATRRLSQPNDIFTYERAYSLSAPPTLFVLQYI